LIIKRIKVSNQLGLHARPSTMLVKKATQFRANLKIRKDEIEVNGKSLLGVLTLAAAYGTELEVVADGIDEKELIKEIEDLFSSGFNEV
jgi:phosphocarrier protein HPr